MELVTPMGNNFENQWKFFRIAAEVRDFEDQQGRKEMHMGRFANLNCELGVAKLKEIDTSTFRARMKALNQARKAGRMQQHLPLQI